MKVHRWANGNAISLEHGDQEQATLSLLNLGRRGVRLTGVEGHRTALVQLGDNLVVQEPGADDEELMRDGSRFKRVDLEVKQAELCVTFPRSPIKNVSTFSEIGLPTRSRYPRLEQWSKARGRGVVEPENGHVISVAASDSTAVKVVGGALTVANSFRGSVDWQGQGTRLDLREADPSIRINVRSLVVHGGMTMPFGHVGLAQVEGYLTHLFETSVFSFTLDGKAENPCLTKIEFLSMSSSNFKMRQWFSSPSEKPASYSGLEVHREMSESDRSLMNLNAAAKEWALSKAAREWRSTLEHKWSGPKSTGYGDLSL